MFVYLRALMCAAGDTISHGLSHNVECIYLCSSVDVLGCVRLHRGAYLRKTVSTPSMCVCHLGEFCSRTIEGEGGCINGLPRRVVSTVHTSTWCGLQCMRTPCLL